MGSILNSKPVIVPAPLQSFVSDPAALKSSDHLPNELWVARQIMHNIEHQHYWKELQVHTHSPITNTPLPVHLISGLSPQRLYVHPDEQVELLKKDVTAEAEREWILPTRLNEKWTLRRLAAVFDAITMVPPAPGASAVEVDDPANPWRTTKRVLLGTVDSDSTVVYYIVHDGVVKPRQN